MGVDRIQLEAAAGDSTRSGLIHEGKPAELARLVGAEIAIESRTLIEDVNFSLGAGECLAVVGPSGSGKSTLLQCIAGLRPVRSGHVIVDGENLATMKPAERDRFRLSRIGLVFQFGELLPELTSVENAALPARYLGRSRAVAERDAASWLKALQVGDLGNRRPEKLSGGQVQRVAIARAMAHGPLLILADEPTGMLDEATTADVVDLLFSCVRQAGIALVVVTHDDGVASAADRVMAVRAGRLVVA